MERVNVFEGRYEYDDADPDGYRGGVLRAGSRGELAVKAFEIPPGESLCPYHYEYVEEWLLVLEGDVVVRVPEGQEKARRGDLVRFEPGPAGAHKLSNPHDTTSRILMFSSAREPAVAVYPDSDKVGVWVPGGADNVMVLRADGNVGYYEGEA